MNKTIRAVLKENFSFFMAVPAILWQVLFLYVPMVLVIGASFITITQLPWWQSFTLSHYVHFFDPLYVEVIIRSLIFAHITAFACLLCAYPLAYFLAIKVIRFKNLLLFFLVLPFFTSLMVQVYAWYFVLGNDGLINSALLKIGLISEPLHLLYNAVSVYLVMVYCYLPFMILPLYSTLEKFDRKLLESSADLGATAWQTFVKITLPLSLPGIKTGFFLVLVPAFGEFVVPTLMGGGKTLFVGTLISQYFLSVRNPFLGAAFTCLAGIGLVLAVVCLYYFFSFLTHRNGGDSL